MTDSKKLLFVVNVDWFFLSHRLPIALAAKEAGFDVTVMTANTGDSEKITEKGLGFINLPTLEKKQSIISELLMVRKLKKLYQEIQPDIIHQVTIRPVLYGSIAARLAGVPAVVNALSGLGHIYTSNTIAYKGIRFFLDGILRTGLKHPNSRLILQNHDDIELFKKRKILDPKKIVLIRGSGVDINIFKPSASDHSKVKIALIGRMLRDKGIIEYIEAAKLLIRNGTEAEFHLYGAPYAGNPTSIPEEEMIELTHFDGIYYHGAKANIAEELKNIDIVCLPSYREGLPKALLEAASSGKPIVTTDVPGCREVVEDGINGFLVPPQNIKMLAEKLQTLIADPELRINFGKAGRKKVIHNFADEMILRQTLDLYEELLA